MKKLLAVITTALAVFAFYEVVASPLHGIIKFVICAILLFLSGMSLQKLLSLNGEWGLIILATERGKKSLDKIAEWNPDFWMHFAAFGMVMGFGASSMLMFKKIPRKTFEYSMLILTLSTLFVLPFVLPTATSIIKLPINVYNISSSISTQPTFVGLVLYYFVFFSLLIGGFSLAGIISFVGYGLIILYSILLKLLSVAGSSAGNASALSGITPGAMPIIPGVNLPFVEGVLSLAVLLFFHEVCHGILARVEKIRVKNSGILLFGFIPVGAFVEPDEEQLQKSNAEKQKNVLVAGSSANLVLSILFFILLILYQTAILSSNPPPESYFNESMVIYYILPGYPAYGVLKEGMVIKQWNGFEIGNMGDFANASKMTKENDTVSVVTDAGSFSLNAGKNGKVGIQVLPVVKSSSDWVQELSTMPGNWWMGFLYNFLGLTFVLNFLVGSVNLLPLPPFDGYRIVSLVVKNEKFLKAMAVIMILMFLINLLPWIWQ